MGLIHHLQQLTTISNGAIDWLKQHTEEFTFKKNEIILPEGKTCNHLYYVVNGLVGSYYVIEDHEVCNWIAMEEDMATCYYSFISREPSYETIVAFEPTTLHAVSYHTIQALYNQFPETERAGRLILENYYSRLEERLISIQFKSAKERYDMLFNKRPEIFNRAPLGRVATYLGMKQETLSRIRSERSGS
ncbi:MAG: Crp/Fnr family transcriptional regulator [Bacteroidota bacterium]|jgi:CRP-like cAMP-binding protein